MGFRGLQVSLSGLNPQPVPIMKHLTPLFLSASLLLGLAGCSISAHRPTTASTFADADFSSKLQIHHPIEVLAADGREHTNGNRVESIALIPGYHEFKVHYNDFNLKADATVSLTAAAGHTYRLYPDYKNNKVDFVLEDTTASADVNGRETRFAATDYRTPVTPSTVKEQTYPSGPW